MSKQIKNSYIYMMVELGIKPSITDFFPMGLDEVIDTMDFVKQFSVERRFVEK